MKPPQVLSFLFAVLLLLSGLEWIVPDDFTLAGFPVKVFRWDTFFENDEVKLPDKMAGSTLQSLQIEAEKLVSSDSTGEQDFDSTALIADTNQGQSLPEVSFHIDSASGIQYPSGDSTLFYSLFNQLDSLKSKKELIRILHFGDSQIEGDRITGYLRQRLQQQFGGCGPGLIPLYEEQPSRFSVEIKSSKPMSRYLIYGKTIPVGHNKYSVLHSTFRLKADSAFPNESIKNSFSYRMRNSGYKRATFFDKATFLVRNPQSKIEFKVLNAGPEKIQKSLSAADSLKLVGFRFPQKRKEFQVEVSSNSGNDLYSVCLDCDFGIAVDNIPLRGSSGIDLLKISPSFLQDQIRQLNVKMVILQFGVNVVPYESPGFGWYESSLIKVIKTIKRAKPGIQVLVVGVSDMAKKTEGQWRSYPNIIQIRDAQRNAAAKTNSAYWDLFEVMGGENSILAWAGTNPPLAGKDYIHLTPKGAQVVGEFLFQSLLKDYRSYSNSKNAKNNPL